MTQTDETIEINQAATLLPMTPHPDDEPGHPVSRPAIQVADVLVFAYVEHDEDTGRRRLVVSVDLDDVDWGYGPQGRVPMRLNVQGDEVWAADGGDDDAGDDGDPYAGQPSALCPECSQPRGHCEHTEGQSMFGAAAATTAEADCAAVSGKDDDRVHLVAPAAAVLSTRARALCDQTLIVRSVWVPGTFSFVNADQRCPGCVAALTPETNP